VDVVVWLQRLGLGGYAESFVENKIDAVVLRQLTDGDLKELGVAALGDRKKLHAAIAALPQQQPAPPAREPGGALLSPTEAPLAYTPPHLAARILDGRNGLEGERKHVTVLFADIKCSTSLVENLDPEDAAQKLGPAISCMMAAVHRYEGTVNKVQGDGIMALFGCPHTRTMLYGPACALATRRDWPRERTRSNCMVSTGEVLVRAIHNDLSMDYDAIGATVNLASRMEQMAPTGHILITAATKALADGFVETRSLGATAVKGIRRDVDVFELLDRTELRMRWEARSARDLTAFVGRRGELDTLLMAAERVRSGQGQLIALIGDAGMGKSRLAWEFLQVSRMKGWSVCQTGASPYSVNDPFLPVATLLRSMFGVGGRDTKAEIDARVMAGLARYGRTSTDLLTVIRFL
jgi:class 3 adenylate cyclase